MSSEVAVNKYVFKRTKMILPRLFIIVYFIILYNIFLTLHVNNTVFFFLDKCETLK